MVDIAVFFFFLGDKERRQIKTATGASPNFFLSNDDKE